MYLHIHSYIDSIPIPAHVVYTNNIIARVPATLFRAQTQIYRMNSVNKSCFTRL